MLQIDAATRAALASAISLIRLNNANHAGWFAVAMLGLMVVFSIIHFVDMILLSRPVTKSGASSAPVIAHRKLRSLMLRKAPGFTSVGHLVVFLVYLIINIILLFTDTAVTLSTMAVRLGWVASYNMCLVTFLGLKNTPLAFFTSYSYERLNVLHQASGYVTVLATTIHGITYICAFAQTNQLPELMLTKNVMGAVAGIALLIMTASALLLRGIRYEVFYSVHIILFMLVIIGMGMHRPITRISAWTFACFAGGAWILDRLLRLTKVCLLNFLGNTATVAALPHGGVRIVLSRTPILATPGTHLFLWLPKARALETHPFTVVSTNPTELVVKAHDGFTRDLYNKAISAAQSEFRVSVDGPYGTLPNFMSFDKIILVAGGSGGSFTFGAINNMLASAAGGKTLPKIHFIWVVREVDQLEWFQAHLARILECANVQVSVHVTNQASSKISHSSKAYSEKTSMQIGVQDLEKRASSSDNSISRDIVPEGLSINYSKPDMASYIRDRISDSDGKTLVAVCGPQSMTNDVRTVVADEVSAGRKRLRLHCESFGW